MGLNNSFQALGRGIGPLWAGFAFDLYSTLSFWTGALVQVIALFFTLKYFGGGLAIVSETVGLDAVQPVPEE